MQEDMSKIPEKYIFLFLKWEFVPAVLDICVMEDSLITVSRQGPNPSCTHWAGLAWVRVMVQIV